MLWLQIFSFCLSYQQSMLFFWLLVQLDVLKIRWWPHAVTSFISRMKSNFSFLALSFTTTGSSVLEKPEVRKRKFLISFWSLFTNLEFPTWTFLTIFKLLPKLFTKANFWSYFWSYFSKELVQVSIPEIHARFEFRSFHQNDFIGYSNESMLVTDVGDQMCWWPIQNVGDRFEQHNEKSRQHNDSANNISNQSPS